MKLDLTKDSLLGSSSMKNDAEGSDDMTDAAQDMLDAITDKDAGALALALRRAMSVGEDEEADTDDEE